MFATVFDGTLLPMKPCVWNPGFNVPGMDILTFSMPLSPLAIV